MDTARARPGVRAQALERRARPHEGTSRRERRELALLERKRERHEDDALPARSESDTATQRHVGRRRMSGGGLFDEGEERLDLIPLFADRFSGLARTRCQHKGHRGHKGKYARYRCEPVVSSRRLYRPFSLLSLQLSSVSFVSLPLHLSHQSQQPSLKNRVREAQAACRTSASRL